MLLRTYRVRFLGIVSSILLFIDVVCVTSQKGCLLNVTNEITEKLLPVPLVNLSSHYELAVPYQGAISLKKGAKINLLCPGPKNYITLTNSNVSTISCFETNLVRLYSKTTNFEDIQCKKIPKGEVLKTEERCGNAQGVIYNIGYHITKKDWVTLIDVCYEPENGTTLYTQHFIHGRAIKYASKATYRPGFSTSGLNDDVTPSVAYKRPYQKATFNKLLKSAKMAEKYVNNKSYLARGHLSPDADFLLATSQYSTYYYINTAPQWQGINGGNWKSVESTVRKLSEPYENLRIITGTHDILTYNDTFGTPEAIFLVSTHKLPVPKYFWKLVYDPDSQKAIVFVVLNDPFIEQVKDRDILCEDICKEAGYTNRAWSKIQKGYVFCCDVKEFEQVVNGVPQLTVKDILRI